MAQPIDPFGENDQDQALSVSAAVGLAKKSLESMVVTMIGEVSEVSIRPGYKAAYFTVKDEAASLSCMMWNNRYVASGIDLAVGQLVRLTGRFTIYAPKGRMNFEVFSLALSGEGELRMRVANLAKRLQAEGLTDQARKRAIPAFPERIGLVTSPRSAAVHDVLRTLRRRFPVAEVLLAGVPVEGAHAAEGIVAGLRSVEAAGAEVILVVRGGGSFEDMMPFNDEQLARAIAACSVPVVTGIGHEVDTSIADMVSDMRASTPTAAAEAVSPSSKSLDASLCAAAQQLSHVFSRRLERTRDHLARIADKAIFQDPMALFQMEAQWIDEASMRLQAALPRQLELRKQALAGFRARLRAVGGVMLDRYRYAMCQGAARLSDLSPLGVLARGYSIARTCDGDVVSHIAQVRVGEDLHVAVSDGVIDCEVRAAQSIEPAEVF